MEKNITKNWNNKYVNLASGLGLSAIKCDWLPKWNEYFVLGYLIDKWYTDDCQKKGYSDVDSCSWLWTDSGLDREEVNEAIYWLTINEYIDQIWLDNLDLGGYKVSEWVLDKMISRKLLGMSGKADFDRLKLETERLEDENFRLRQENYQLRQENKRLKRENERTEPDTEF